MFRMQKTEPGRFLDQIFILQRLRLTEQRLE